MYLLIQQLLLNVYCVPNVIVSAFGTEGTKALRQTDHWAEVKKSKQARAVSEDQRRRAGRLVKVWILLPGDGTPLEVFEQRSHIFLLIFK